MVADIIVVRLSNGNRELAASRNGTTILITVTPLDPENTGGMSAAVGEDFHGTLANTFVETVQPAIPEGEAMLPARLIVGATYLDLSYEEAAHLVAALALRNVVTGPAIPADRMDLQRRLDRFAAASNAYAASRARFPRDADSRDLLDDGELAAATRTYFAAMRVDDRAPPGVALRHDQITRLITERSNALIAVRKADEKLKAFCNVNGVVLPMFEDTGAE